MIHDFLNKKRQELCRESPAALIFRLFPFAFWFCALSRSATVCKFFERTYLCDDSKQP